MLRELVATVPDKGYKGCWRPSPFSISFSSVSSFASLLNVPLIRLELTDGDYGMGTFDKSKSTTNPKGRMRSATASVPSAPIAPSTSNSTTHSSSFSNAIHSVRRLPRKASRLVCIADKSDTQSDSQCSRVTEKRHDNEVRRNDNRSNGATNTDERVKSPAATVERSCSSGSGSSSTAYSTSSTCYTPSSMPSMCGCQSDMNQSKVRNHAQSHGCIPGPIISPSELAKALERQSLASQPTSGSRSSGMTSRRDSVTARPRVDSLMHVAVPMPSVIIEEGPVPRPLSPPPDHFRRRERVLSGPGPSLGPYTTPSPVNSPPISPRTSQQQLRLHDLLSNESLVAHRLTLYNGTRDDFEDEDDDECRSIYSDIGSNARTLVQHSGHRASSSITSRDRTSVLPKSGCSGRHSGTQSRIPQPRNEHNEHALRRVFSR